MGGFKSNVLLIRVIISKSVLFVMTNFLYGDHISSSIKTINCIGDLSAIFSNFANIAKFEHCRAAQCRAFETGIGHNTRTS